MCLPEWFKAVQGLHCIALGLMLLACGHALFTNCCLRHVTYSRMVELSAGVGGMVGFVGAMVYVTKTSPVLKMNRAITYSWAFGADVASCIIVVIIAGVIGVSNGREDGEDRSLILEEIHQHDLPSGHRHRLVGVSSSQLERQDSATSTTSPRPTRSTGPNTEVFVVQTNYPAIPDPTHRTTANMCLKTAGCRDLNIPCGVSSQRCCHQSSSTTVVDETKQDQTTESRTMPDQRHLSSCLPGDGQSACSSSGLSCACTKKPFTSPKAKPARIEACLPPYIAHDPKNASGSVCTCDFSEKSSKVSTPVTPACPLPPYHAADLHNHLGSGCCSWSEKNLNSNESLPVCQCHDDDVAAAKAAPLVEASAPPPEYSHTDFATAQFFANSDTVLIGDGPRREQ
ncbi:hypothetical protein BaRGS_00000883 [Batillaria attramentaria]|uniref:Uncharacterized protein n=1 Tax=Batillaria attramentaria TaxID=370345 RepID=A0ABD0M9L2_9CAEN